MFTVNPFRTSLWLKIKPNTNITAHVAPHDNFSEILKKCCIVTGSSLWVMNICLYGCLQNSHLGMVKTSTAVSIDMSSRLCCVIWSECFRWHNKVLKAIFGIGLLRLFLILTFVLAYFIMTFKWKISENDKRVFSWLWSQYR